MKSSKTFNNVSDKLLSEIPKLKPGQVVLFKMLNGVPNPEPDEKERSKSPFLFGKRQIQTNFRIYDKYHTELKDDDGKVTYQGDYVDVGCVDYWNGDKPERFRCFIPGQGEFSQFQGKFQLMGGVVKDEELYQILWLSHEREGNPDRDTSVEALFKIVDARTDSGQAISNLEKLKKALALPTSLTVAEMRSAMSALNQPDYQDEIVLKAQFGELCRSKPELILSIVESADTPMLATIKQALNSGLITHDFASGEVKLGGVVIHVMKLDDLSTAVPQLLQWIKTSANGKDVYANICAQLKEKIPVADK
jgi:hypothetical protein